MNILLFGGTGEGRELAQWLLEQKIPALVCVATEYGETLLPPGAASHVGRMDRGEMEQLMHSRPFTHVVDATHPYELDAFARPGLVERCYPRVLPMADSLDRCLKLGFPPRNIICMQGPFSKELNVALLRQYRIKTLVTKDTGGYGGFREKAEAAREAGCALLVVERPSRETGLTLEELQTALKEEQA